MCMEASIYKLFVPVFSIIFQDGKEKQIKECVLWVMRVFEKMGMVMDLKMNIMKHPISSNIIN